MLLLSLVLGLSGLAAGGAITAQAASGNTDKTYSMTIGSSSWGHPALSYMNGMSHEAKNQWVALFVNATDHRICYCIEPGIHIGNWATEDTTYTEKDEDWFTENLLVNGFNDTIDGDTIKEHLGRIMQYGYVGSAPWAWQDNPMGHKADIAQSIATQLLVWEVIVGERDENFNHVTVPSGYNQVLEQIGSSHPLRQEIINAYENIAYSVQNHVGRPSFLAAKSSDAQTVTLKWDGSKYSATLTDNNNVLSNYNFSASGVSCTVSGNQLTISATTAPSSPVTITARKQAARKGVLVWYKENSQTMISYTQEVDDLILGYVNVEAEQKGKAQIVKNTTNGGDRSGWHFVLKDPSGNTMGPSRKRYAARWYHFTVVIQYRSQRVGLGLPLR